MAVSLVWPGVTTAVNRTVKTINSYGLAGSACTRLKLGRHGVMTDQRWPGFWTWCSLVRQPLNPRHCAKQCALRVAIQCIPNKASYVMVETTRTYLWASACAFQETKRRKRSYVSPVFVARGTYPTTPLPDEAAGAHLS